MLGGSRNQKTWTAQPMDMKARHPTLGSILSSLRARNGWTLKEMSERTDIPVSTLSKVEHDRLTLTYDKLLQVSQRLNLSLSELLSDPGSGVPSGETSVTARRSIGLVGDAVRVNTRNYDYYYLCPELRKKRMIPVFARIRAKSLEDFGALVRHSGEEYIYVLEGGITVHTEFYDPVVLRSGESIYVDSSMGHAYVAEGCDEATVLAVCSSADESLMESLMSLHGDGSVVRPEIGRPEETPKRSARQPKSRKR